MSLRPASITAASTLAALSALALCAAPTSAAPKQISKGSTAKPPRTVAHRAGAGHAPENTLPAVDRAHKSGFGWVENDVQRTKDGELVVIHDTTLKRTTNVESVFPGRAPYNVSDFTAAEISKLDAGSWYGKKYRGTKIPTLKQYLQRLTKNKQKLLLELKSPAKYPGIEVQTLRELGSAGWLDDDHLKSRLVVQSFDADAVRTVHSTAPRVKTGYLGTPKASNLKKYAKFSDQINATYSDASTKYVNAVHKLKGPQGNRLEVYTWTVNTAPKAAKAAGRGVDGIISNYPDIVREETGG